MATYSDIDNSQINTWVFVNTNNCLWTNALGNTVLWVNNTNSIVEWVTNGIPWTPITNSQLPSWGSINNEQ